MTERASALLAGVVLAGSCVALAVADDAQTLSGPVYAVSDGNVLMLGPDTARVPVRLWGIAAPEFGRQCAGWRGSLRAAPAGRYPCGAAAAERLYAMTARDRQVTCEVRYRDELDRPVAVCRNREGDLGGRLVAQGWAVDNPAVSGGYYRDHEGAARGEGLGMHGGGR